MSAISALGSSLAYRYSPPAISPQTQEAEMDEEGEEISVAESEETTEVDASSDESGESADDEPSPSGVGGQIDISA